jgi:hypothetical protein
LNAPATTSAKKTPLTARDRLVRCDRIFARMLEGQAYNSIAAAEGITPRRVRKIVQEALLKNSVRPQRDFVLVQIARMEGALRLVEQKLQDGNLNAVDRLVKVLEKLDLYHAQASLPSLPARRDPWFSADTLACMDRIAATRAAVALRFTGSVKSEEISSGTANASQSLEFVGSADGNGVPGALESRI